MTPRKPTYEELENLAKWAQTLQPEALAIMRREGFVLDDLNDRWQKLAFTLYSSLCELESKSRYLFEEV